MPHLGTATPEDSVAQPTYEDWWLSPRPENFRRSPWFVEDCIAWVFGRWSPSP